MGKGTLISITMTPQARDARGWYAKIEGEMRLAVIAAMSEGGQEALEIAQQNAPVNTGGFEQSLQVHEKIIGDAGSGFEITTTEPDVLRYLQGVDGMITAHRNIMVFSRPWAHAPVSPNYGNTWAYVQVKGQEKNPWQDRAQQEIMDRLSGRLATVMNGVDWSFT